MIYTVTLNPSLDYVLYLDAFRPGEVNRSRREALYPGGKGLNVSLVLHRLGVPTRALGFAAGFTGHALLDLLENQGLSADFLPLSGGETRINVKLREKQESEVNARGPALSPGDLEALAGRLDELRSGDFLVLAGSLPASLQPDLYARLLDRCADRGIEAVVDAEGDLLRQTLPRRPFLVKPNRRELEGLLGRPLPTRDALLEGARELRRLGARNVLVSLAGDGALLVTEQGEVLSAAPPRGRVVNSVGAGDSMVAGFLAGWCRTGDPREALRLGVAAGSATAFREWLAAGEDVAELIEDVTVSGG